MGAWRPRSWIHAQSGRWLVTPNPGYSLEPSLGERAIDSAKWMTLSRIVCEAGSFLAVIALARLLTPVEVGNAVLAMIVPALANSMISGSFASALVKEHDITDAQVEVATVLSLLTGAGLTLVVCVVALALTQVLGNAYAANVALASPSVLFASISAVPQALRTRRFSFKALMWIEVSSDPGRSSLRCGTRRAWRRLGRTGARRSRDGSGHGAAVTNAGRLDTSAGGIPTSLLV